MQPAVAPPQAPPTDVSFSALFEETWRLVKKHPVPLLVLPVLLGVITGAGNTRPRYSAGTGAFPSNPLVLLPFFALLGALALVALVLIVLANAWVSLVTTRAALDAIQTGREPDLGASVRAVGSGFWSALGTLLLSLLVVIVAFICLVVPGFIALAGLWPIVSIILVEGQGGAAALRRAWDLTKGHKWTVFGFGLVVLLCGGVASAILGAFPLVGGALGGVASGAASGFLLVAAAVFYTRRVAATSPPPAPPAASVSAPPAW